MTDQARHNRLVTALMNSAKGDLILNNRGHVCYRRMYDEVTGKDLPFAQHTCREILAYITSEGWLLSSDGAQFILENCGHEKRDVKWLRGLAMGRDVHVCGFHL